MLSSSADKRPQLFNAATVLLAAAVFASGFYGLYLSQAGLRSLLGQKTDELASIYLRIMVRMNPGDPELRLALVRHLKDLGRLGEAREVLEPWQARGHGEVPVQLLALDLDWEEFHAVPPHSPERARVLRSLETRLERLAGAALAMDEAVRLAEISRQINRPDLAAGFYARMADLALTGADAERYALAALKSLRAADRGTRALELAILYSRRFPRSEDILRFGVETALARNDTPRARDFGRLLVRLAPGDSALLEKQIDLELATGDLPAALELADRRARAEPGCTACRERLARIAEWAGQPETALEAWAWLALERGSEPALAEALRLAAGLYRDDLWLKLAKFRYRTRPLTPAGLREMETVHARSRTAEDWLAFVREALARQPGEPFLWKALAEAQARVGNAAAAIAAWETLGSRFGARAEAARRVAELRWEAGDADGALAELRNHRRYATGETPEFWRLYGEIAWASEQDEDAAVAYRTLVDLGLADGVAYERLVDLSRDARRFEEAADLAAAARRKLGTPRYTLLAMDSALQGGHWNKLRTLLESSEPDRDYLESRESYWLMRAALAQHENRTGEAQEAYGRALALDPGSTAARAGLLWLLIDHRRTGELRRQMRAWEADARQQPELWGAFGGGYAALRQYRAALPWFELQYGGRSGDALWLLGYAEVLQENGRAKAAWRLRRHVLARLGRLLGPTGAGRPAESPAYLRLLGEFRGAPSRDRVLAVLLAAEPNHPAIRQLALDAALADGNAEAARFWMFEAQRRGQKVPAWQRLSVALAANDRAGVARILAEEGDALSPADRAAALASLGRKQEALGLAREQSADGTGASEALELQRRQLEREAASVATAGWEIRRLADLDVQRALASFSFRPADDQRLTLAFSRNDLRQSAGGIVAPGRAEEFDVSLKWNARFESSALSLAAGGNLRDRGSSLPYGSATLTRPLASWLTAGLDIGVNEVTEDSSALRAMGSKSQIAAQVIVQPTRREYGRLKVAGLQYQTRSGDRLGEGYRIEGEIGTHLLLGEPFLQLRLQGSLQANRLVGRVPESLTDSGTLGPEAAPSDIIAPEFRMFGAGFRLGIGETEGYPGRLSASVDGWLGGLWPAGQFAYRFSGSLGASLLGPDRLSVDAFYSNVQGGLPGQSFGGVQVSYGLWF